MSTRKEHGKMSGELDAWKDKRLDSVQMHKHNVL